MLLLAGLSMRLAACPAINFSGENLKLNILNILLEVLTLIENCCSYPVVGHVSDFCCIAAGPVYCFVVNFKIE